MKLWKSREKAEKEEQNRKEGAIARNEKETTENRRTGSRRLKSKGEINKRGERRRVRERERVGRTY